VSPYDRRTELQRSIDQYVYVLLVASGEKNPIRRKAFEADVAFALEAAEPYKTRYDEVMRFDIFALDDSCDAAVAQINEALEVLRRIGAETALPLQLENPRTVLAECAMAVIDTLRSLDAFDAGAVEILIEVLLRSFDPEGIDRLIDRRLKIFLHRYSHDTIPAALLDRMALEERFLASYLESL